MTTMADVMERYYLQLLQKAKTSAEVRTLREEINQLADRAWQLERLALNHVEDLQEAEAQKRLAS